MPRFNGGNRAETLLGSERNDILTARRGDDLLIGAGGNDRLFGGAGDDALIADAGSDRLTGGRGADRFVIVDGTEEDVIRDFDGRRDTLDFVPLGARSLRELDFARERGGAVTLTFEDHSVRVEGDFSLRQLRRSIDLADRDFLKFEQLRPRGESFADAERLDDLATYRGFQWDNWGLLDTRRLAREVDSGYTAASGRTVLYTRGASVIQSDEPFDFESMRAAGAWRDNLNVVVTGFAGQEEIGSQIFTLGRHGRLETLELDDDIFNAVSRVEITSYGGRISNENDGEGIQISIDDIELFS
ncbi:MAG: hypothetical protein AAGI51_12485 [Pseudomonadota bacterium]